MQMRKILWSPSLAFDSALVKYTASELGLFDLNHNCKIYFSGSSTVCSTTAATVTGTAASRNIPIVGTVGPSGYARSVLPERSLPSTTHIMSLKSIWTLLLNMVPVGSAFPR